MGFGPNGRTSIWLVQASISRNYDRAVVIGGSIAGLAAARALSHSFREVVVVERDTLNRERPEHRPGVPQSWHIHSLMLRGQHELEALFPGVCETALELGAVRIDHARDLVAWSKYGWWPRYDSGLVPLCATRALLEFAERTRFFALTKNATVLDNTRVLELITESQRGGFRARGVVTNHPDHPTIQADLVIDCSGRAARWKEWFKQRSVPLPRETVVDAGCGYASRFYRPRDPDAFSWKAMVCDTAFPQHPRYGAIIPIEDGQWLVTLGCFNDVYPPTDEEGYLDFRALLRDATVRASVGGRGADHQGALVAQA
jgi:flavin-dependent dehydrogenase